MSSMFDLTGKVAVIAGASAGLGADASLAYAEAGADVALLARRIEKLETLKNEIVEKTGRKVIAIQPRTSCCGRFSTTRCAACTS